MMTMLWETELEAVKENARLGESWPVSLERAQSVAIRLDGILRQILTETFGIKPKGKFTRHVRIELYRYLFSELNKRPENKVNINSGKDLSVGEVWALDMLMGQETVKQTLAAWMLNCGKLEKTDDTLYSILL